MDNPAGLTSMCCGDDISTRVPDAQVQSPAGVGMSRIEVVQCHGDAGEALPPRVARQVQHNSDWHGHCRRRQRWRQLGGGQEHEEEGESKSRNRKATRAHDQLFMDHSILFQFTLDYSQLARVDSGGIKFIAVASRVFRYFNNG